jgi:hypothetical protein
MLSIHSMILLTVLRGNSESKMPQDGGNLDTTNPMKFAFFNQTHFVTQTVIVNTKTVHVFST